MAQSLSQGSLALASCGAAVFLVPAAPESVVLQGLFFLVLFPWIVWPLIAASRSVVSRCP